MTTSSPFCVAAEPEVLPVCSAQSPWCDAMRATASCTASSYVKPLPVVTAITGAIASFTAMRSERACTSWRSSRVHSLVWRVISWRSRPSGPSSSSVATSRRIPSTCASCAASMTCSKMAMTLRFESGSNVSPSCASSSSRCALSMHVSAPVSSATSDSVAAAMRATAASSCSEIWPLIASKRFSTMWVSTVAFTARIARAPMRRHWRVFSTWSSVVATTRSTSASVSTRSRM